MLSNSEPREKDPTDTFFDDLYEGSLCDGLSIFRSVCSIAEKRKPFNELRRSNY